MRQRKVHTQLDRAAVQIFAVNDRMNQVLIEHLDPAAWRAQPPGKVRTIAAIFTHVHNVRCKWVRLTAPHLKVPTAAQPLALHATAGSCGLAESATRCGEMLGEALGGEGRVEKFQQRWLGSAMAGWRGDAVLHDCSRSSPSRPGVYARASARIPVADSSDVRNLELGEALEGVRGAWGARPSARLAVTGKRRMPPWTCAFDTSLR